MKKLFKKVAAGLLLAFGISFSIRAIADILNEEIDIAERHAAITVLSVLLFPSTAVGGWLIWQVYREEQQEKRGR